MTTTTMTPAETAEIMSALHVQVPQKALLSALQLLAPAISRCSTLPILSNVKIEASPLGIVLSATNFEQYVTVRLPLDEQTLLVGDGACTVNYKELVEIIKPLKKQLITLRFLDKKLLIESAALTVALETLDVEEYPAAPVLALREDDELIQIQQVALPVAQLTRMVKLTAFAAAGDESRPVLTSLCVELKRGVLSLTAADVFRLATIQEPVEAGGHWNYAALLPAASIAALLAKLPLCGNVTLSVDRDRSQAFLEMGSITVVTRTIEGTYLNYERIIPIGADTRSTTIVETAPLLSALQVIKPIAKDSSNITRIHVTVDGIEVKAQRDGMDTPMIVRVPAQTSGTILEILLNLQYLAGVLAHSKTVRIDIIDATKPVRVTSPELPNWIGVIMPMYVNR